MKHIKNILFDLGGVIINLDVKKTIDEFNRVSNLPFESIYTQTKQSQLFSDFEKGKISGAVLFKQIKKELNYKGNEISLLYAWNAMLQDVPEERLDTLVEAKQNYNTYLLSNTNEVHIADFEYNLYHMHGVKNFEDYFDRTYYSCRVGLRKPEKEIFEMILNQNKILASETVFIDDSIQHVKGAGACGINAYLLPKNMEVSDLLKQLKLL